MKSKQFKQIRPKAIAIAVMLATGSTMALAASNEDHKEMSASEQDTDYLNWQETKRTASKYWQDFTQDSEQTWDSAQEAFRDGWVEGKLETAIVLNDRLNPFDINIEVTDSTATLEGKVDTAVQKELAQNVALGIEGIDNVDNMLKVEKTERKAENIPDESRDFGRFVNDSVLTADVKTDLMASESVSALAINVDVNRARVTLSGEVSSEAEKELAEMIVANNPDVREVDNQLKVES